jgi:hypothetical protein
MISCWLKLVLLMWFGVNAQNFTHINANLLFDVFFLNSCRLLKVSLCHPQKRNRSTERVRSDL